MMLHINDNLTIAEVQDRFTECYPGLKIEFYTAAHHPGLTSPGKNQIQPQCRIGDIRKVHNRGELTIMSWYTVAKVEMEFRKKFGLHVQVFRAQDKEWIQTGASDRLTIAEQRNLSEKGIRFRESSDQPHR